MPRIDSVLDTTFFTLHFFSGENEILNKTREVLRRSRLQGNRGLIPTIVLSEFYAQAAKTSGSKEAKRRFDEMVDSGLEIADLGLKISERAGVIRHKYQEKIPWGDCIIAATALEFRAESVITEDHHFKSIREIKSRTIGELIL